MQAIMALWEAGNSHPKSDLTSEKQAIVHIEAAIIEAA